MRVAWREARRRSRRRGRTSAVEGALTGDREMIYRAVQMDPLTGALLPLSKIRELVDELFAAEAEYLPQFSARPSAPRLPLPV